MSYRNMITEYSPPESPGVYIMKNSKGTIIYIGKAKNLSNRIKSYFGKNSEGRYQIDFLLAELEDVEYIVTRDERDAFLLENALIKKNRPKYNIQLKDDKTYFLLKLDMNQDYPRLYLTRKQSNDDSLYLGPFSSAISTKKTKKLLHKMFPLRDCTSNKFKRHNKRPCLNYNMRLCSGPCAGKVSKDEYKSIVEKFELYTRGRFGEILNALREDMRCASNELRYEDAAIIRDQIEFLEMHIDTNGLPRSQKGSRDIFGIYNESSSTALVILHYRSGAIMDKREYYFDNVIGDESQLIEEFIISYYSRTNSYPDEVNIPFRLSSMVLINEWINKNSPHKVKITVPMKGKKLEYINLARKNAINCYERYSLMSDSVRSMLNSLKVRLNLNNVPDIIECCDISNIQGKDAVASLVRFENGRKVKEKYKRYRIKSVTGANDFAMIREVISRRIKRYAQEGWGMPSMFLIDGGPGQLKFARDAMKGLKFNGGIDIIAIAKSRLRGESDKIYTCRSADPIILDNNSNELRYLMRVRDEAHRFALDYHKKLRDKKAIFSEYESIPNIGQKRKRILQKNFGSLKNLNNLTVDEISSIDGISRKLAISIKEYLKTINL